MDKKYIIKEHIGIFKNFMPNELIDGYLNFFNKCEKQGAIYPRKEDEMLVSDNAIDTIGETPGISNVAMTYNNTPFINIFFKNVYPLYAQKYSYLKKLATHNILEVKIQKTKIGEGYHTWHCENAQMKARNRIMAFMVYLNDVTEGGETEFLYQQCRFKPEKNTTLIWPANFTHVHRGNPPLSNDKYIITGWVEYGY
tara:strand:+ start:250 stop:840 length:591 start_codon:yes stop_codon:yes gene_type:complete